MDAAARRPYRDLVIIRARFVLTMEGPPIPDGAAAVTNGCIVDVGLTSEVKARNAGP